MINSIHRAFKIIDFVSENQGKCSLAEISRAVNLNKTTTFRYLNTLENTGIIIKRDHSYSLGMKLFELGHKVYLSRMLIDIIHPYLEELCEKVNETVNCAKIENNQILYLDKIGSTRSLQIQTRIGTSKPLHCTALGKAAFSLMKKEKIKQIISTLEMEAKTPFTLIDRDQLLSQVLEIKKKGFAIDDQELEEGLKCIAVPLYLEQFNFIGAVSLAGPSRRFDSKTITKYVKELKSVVQKVKTKLNE